MSIKTLNKGKNAKKGISPVIATVILVAVAVVIAAALAGFSSSLFGSYSQSSQITVRSMTATVDDAADGNPIMVTMDVVNKGGAPETVTTVVVQNFGEALPANILVGTAAPIVPANGEAQVTAQIDADATKDVDAGQTVTMTITTQSGQSYTISSVLQAP